MEFDKWSKTSKKVCNMLNNLCATAERTIHSSTKDQCESIRIERNRIVDYVKTLCLFVDDKDINERIKEVS